MPGENRKLDLTWTTVNSKYGSQEFVFIIKTGTKKVLAMLTIVQRVSY